MHVDGSVCCQSGHPEMQRACRLLPAAPPCTPEGPVRDPTPPCHITVTLAGTFLAGCALGVERRPHGGQQFDAGILAEVHPGLLPPTS